MSAPLQGRPRCPSIQRMPRRPTCPQPQLSDEALAALKPPRSSTGSTTRHAGEPRDDTCAAGPPCLPPAYYTEERRLERNAPFRSSDDRRQLAKLPTYYIMELTKTMPETVAPEMPSPAEIAACKWLRDDELTLYTTEYQRTGFQGGLHGYRVRLTDKHNAQLQTFSGRTIDVPSLFVAGKSDWGVFQTPGALESMQKTACTRMSGVHLVEKAGHWVQQEQADAVSKLLLQFFSS